MTTREPSWLPPRLPSTDENGNNRRSDAVQRRAGQARAPRFEAGVVVRSGREPARITPTPHRLAGWRGQAALGRLSGHTSGPLPRIGS